MLSNPRVGDTVQVWYRKELRGFMPHQGKIGTVVVANKARRCRNHGVEIDGNLVIVPCGNLRKPERKGQ